MDERGAALCADRFDCDGMLRLTGRRLREAHAVPLPGRFWAAGLSFSRKELLLEVCNGASLQKNAESVMAPWSRAGVSMPDNPDPQGVSRLTIVSAK